MNRVRRGLGLVGASWQLLSQDRGLIWLPVMSFVAIVLLSGAILSPLLVSATGNGRTNGALFVLVVVVYFVATVIGTFFNAALVGAAAERLDGSRGHAVDGLRIAWSRLGTLLQWAGLTATVGLVLRVLEARTGALGSVATRIAGVTWSVATFLVVPVLVLEHLGPIDALKRSGSLFRQRWGEQLVGEGSIGFAATIIGLIVFGVTVTLTALAGSYGGILGASGVFALGIVAFVVVIAIGSALSGIFNAALYVYAVTGTVKGPYSEEDFSGAFRRL